MSNNLPTRPIFVVIEGLPGCRTTEVATAVAARFTGPVYRPAWNCPWSFMPEIRRAMDRECEAQPQAAMLLKALMTLTIKGSLEAELQEGHLVVLDRYWLSAVVPHSILGAADHLEGIMRQILKTDVTYYLHAPLAIRSARVEQMRRDDAAAVRWTLEPSHDAKLDAGYRARERYPIVGDFVALDATQPIEILVDQVIADILARQPPNWRR